LNGTKGAGAHYAAVPHILGNKANLAQAARRERVPLDLVMRPTSKNRPAMRTCLIFQAQA
jgi:hypothetical protein